MVPPFDPAAKTGGKTTMGGFARGRLSPDEAERLAATFRPCWALDESQSAEADTLVRAVRGTYVGLAPAPVAYATNGAHAPPAPTPSHEPENSIIIDRSGMDDTQPGVLVASSGQAAKGPSGTLILRPSNAPKPRPSGAPDARRHGGPNQPQVVPSVRPQSVSVSFEEAYPRPSRKGLWIGMGAVAAALVGIGIWAASNAGGMDAPVPIPIKPVQDKTAATVLPPLPESITKPQVAPPPQPAVAPPPPVLAVPPQAAPPPAAPQAETLPKATAPPSPPVPAAPAPAPPPAPIRVTAAPAPRPYYPPAVRTPPPQRPKAGSPTIVREVPF
jgi:hypothetical protein